MEKNKYMGIYNTKITLIVSMLQTQFIYCLNDQEITNHKYDLPHDNFHLLCFEVHIYGCNNSLHQENEFLGSLPPRTLNT